MLNYDQPDSSGHFGPYGGSFVAETLVHALDELNAAYAAARPPVTACLRSMRRRACARTFASL